LNLPLLRRPPLRLYFIIIHSPSSPKPASSSRPLPTPLRTDAGLDAVTDICPSHGAVDIKDKQNIFCPIPLSINCGQ
jgi:hypothetical protein